MLLGGGWCPGSKHMSCRKEHCEQGQVEAAAVPGEAYFIEKLLTAENKAVLMQRPMPIGGQVEAAVASGDAHIIEKLHEAALEAVFKQQLMAALRASNGSCSLG